ncbi:hypothetical protein M413DRAFT_442310 [Hebeloma cylindrosporum]|uniref:Uncharacterized protein n=1 Tax=Hebeloma cylindrosporum TaxID=76867 RepID=A0A0C3CA38_HEBCY|nr:hypothetical protein M413DRAFT_442310 [Hebeloma cylindrosporum h7]
MTRQCLRCIPNKKILRPARCVALDGSGNPCSACTEDIELERELENLEIMIEKIHTKRRAVRTAMNQNHDPFIHKFPPEIASHIFMQYAPPGGLYFDAYERRTPLQLGAVCQKWRQLAWRTPQIWSWLNIKLDPDPFPSQILAEYLQRSASLPLTIGLRPYSGLVIADNIYRKAIDILNKHSSRWRVLHSTIPARHLHRLRGSTEGNILQRLVLRPFKEINGYYDDSTVAPFRMKCKPSPTHLTLAKQRLAKVDITWNYLTNAEIEYIGVDECFELMRRAPLLENLKFLGIITSSGDFPIPAAKVILHHLNRLAIWDISEEFVVAGILDSMCAPSLKYWDYRMPLAPACLTKNMVTFINQSSFSLETLEVSGSPHFYDHLHQVLDHLSSLKSLTLGFRYRSKSPTNELLNRLCTSTESSPFLPLLQTLEFDPQFTFPWESLPRLFSSSNRQSLTVIVEQRIGPRLTNEVNDKLLELVDEGFDLNIFRDDVDVLEEYRQKRSQATHQEIALSSD